MTDDRTYEQKCSLMRDVAMHYAVGYANGCADLSGLDLYKVMMSDEYRAFTKAWQAADVARVIGEQYDRAVDIASTKVADQAKEAFKQYVMITTIKKAHDEVQA